MNDELKDWTVRLGRYVIAQVEDDWHVLFAPDDLPHHYLSVARFQDFTRAKMYADVETDLKDNGEPTTEQEDVHAIADMREDKISVNAVSLPKSAPETRAPLSELEQEIIADLPKLMEEHPNGASVKELSEFYGEPEHRLRQASQTLANRGLALFERCIDTQEMRLTPVGHGRSKKPLTEIQQALLSAMKKFAVDGVVEISRTTLTREAGVKLTSLADITRGLEGKGWIQRISLGVGVSPPKFRILQHPDAA